MTKFTDESQLLNEAFRKEVLKEIVNGRENLERKAQALRRHEIFRDQNKKWVMEAIKKEGFKPETVEQMRNRATNINVCGKIVKKLAQTYIGGVDRSVGEPVTAKDEKTGKQIKLPNPDQKSIEALVDELDFNTHMKTCDQYRQLQRNALIGCIPIKDTRATREARGVPKYCLTMKVLSPWQYDVIEDPNDREELAVVILTDFPERIDFANDSRTDLESGAQGMRTSGTVRSGPGDGIDQIIADSPEDQNSDKRTFIWWSDSFHFTTDINGRIIGAASPADILNPIRRLPWVNIATGQDGSFWAQGGDDVVETSLLINKKLTDVNFISFVQGWGQMVIAAMDIPKKLVGGPDNAFVFEKKDPTETVQVEYASSNPPIEAWLETVRMILALVLSTNDLSPRNIAAKLDATTAPSGIALMIENSEVMADMKDVQELFRDKEPEVWEIIRDWHTMFATNNWLEKDQQDIPTFKDADVNLKFLQMKTPISEKDKLEEMKLRKDLGIATLVDLLRQDNPDLTEEEAQTKAEELMAEKKKMAEFVTNQAIGGQNSGIKNGNGQGEGEQGAGAAGAPGGERKASGGSGDQAGGPGDQASAPGE